MSVTLIAITILIANSAHTWLPILRDTILDKSREAALDKGKEFLTAKGSGLMRRAFHLDKKEQIRHLEQALKNASERGLTAFATLEERDRYKDILYTLMQIGPQNQEVLKEALQLFTLADEPDFARLGDLYNRAQRRTAAAQTVPYTDVNIDRYLTSFFNALIAELYADSYFKQQMSDVLQVRAAKNMQQALFEVVALLRQIGETLEQNYTAEQLAEDVEDYVVYLQRTLQYLKIVGVVPKERIRDPELRGIFVPLRITTQKQADADDPQADSIVSALEQSSSLVLLGGPGSGKSTAMRYLAWSHAEAHQSAMQANPSLAREPLLTGVPLPLLIELRRFSDERRRGNYDFLSFATEVVLKREGVEIKRQMFKELLTRRALLLLFDGLDEVSTVDDRIRLVEEIEHFALSYPGNRVIVTSRPVGYDLARFSSQQFAHAEVLPFNNVQIQQFLQNWYTAVLGLSPIPHRDQQELNSLAQILQGNTRLHRLAENPLLLTVITALHRYERLPDKRVLVYDRCADLLLETWAKIRGTRERWSEMRMVKEDQYACIAHLAFMLHNRTQEEQDGADEDIMSDITARIMLQEIERFLRSRNLMAEGTQLRTEARGFIELMQVEAGLIVERGTAENGEALYGFVHRTFQEYFAAAHVYEQFQQSVDITVIKDFLVEHVHDPHWREVTLLLLAKLHSRPVTALLRQLYQGTLVTRRSQGTAILQQDLFFVCTCLTEDITVENDLAQGVIMRLCDVVKNSVFCSQRKEAVRYLCALMRTRQYSILSRSALMDTIITNDSLVFLQRIEALQVFYDSSSASVEDREIILGILEKLLLYRSFSLEETYQLIVSLGSGADFKTVQVRNDISANLYLRVSSFLGPIAKIALLYEEAFENSENESLAMEVLKRLPSNLASSVESACLAAIALYLLSSEDSEERQVTIREMKKQLEKPNLSIEQMCIAVLSLDTSSLEDSEERRVAIGEMKKYLEESNLSEEQIRGVAISLHLISPEDSEEEQFAIEELKKQLEKPNLSIEQTCVTAISLLMTSYKGSEDERFAKEELKKQLGEPNLSEELTILAMITLYVGSSEGSEDERFAKEELKKQLGEPNLSEELTILAAITLYEGSPEDSEEQRFATTALLPLIQKPDLLKDWNVVYLILREIVPQFDKINI